MTGEPEQKPNEFRSAREAYVAFLEKQREGEDVSFEDFCVRYPELAEDLKKLDAGYRLGQSATLSRSFQESIRQHFGDVQEVTVALTSDGSAEITAGFSSGGAANLEPTELTEGEGFGRYAVQGEVARGGMGAVYRVRDPDLSRTLAMKVMLGSPGDPGSSTEATRANLARFVEEAQVTAQLDHPGIVPVHELGFDAKGRVYFTMQLVKGRDLSEIFALARKEKEGWNLPRAVGVMVKACQALAYAHAKKVVHRDLKPANIMAGRFGEVYVMDWGLAKIAGRKDLHDIRLQNTTEMTYTSIRSDRKSSAESSAESPLITMDGSVVGTPAYMPPEQARGEVEEVDPLSDVYSLGAILYNLLTGQAPYVEPTGRISPHTILARVLDGSPKRVHELNPRASPELAAVCEKAMARDKKNRYRSSLEMAEDLQAYLDRRVVRAYRTGAVAEFRSWVARNKGMAASAAAALLLALCGLVVVAWVQLEAKRSIQIERDNALTAQANEERERTRAEEALALVTAERDLKNEALEQKTLALAEKDRALARAEGLFLTGKASQEIATNPGRALLLAVEGIERQGEVSGLTNQVLLDTLRADRELRVLEGSGESVREVAYRPDGEMIAAVESDVIRLWEAASGEPVSLLLDPEGYPLQNLEFSPDGRFVAATSWYPSRALLFEVPSGRLAFVLEGHLSPGLESVAFSPDGTRVVTASHDGTARIYDVSNGALIAELKGHRCGLRSASFSPDSSRVVTASCGSTYEFKPEGGYSSSSTVNTTARLWEASSGEEILRIAHRYVVRVATFSPKGKRILSSSNSGLKLHDAASGDEIALALSGEPIHALWSPDGDVIALGADAVLRRWSTDPVEEVWSSSVPYGSQADPAPSFSPDGRLLALLESQTSVGLRDAASGRLLKTFRGHRAPVTSLSFHPDGTRLITGSEDGTVRLWNTETDVQFGDLQPARRYAGAKKIILSPGGHRVLVVDDSESASVVDRVSGRDVSRLKRSRAGGLQFFERERFETAFFHPTTGDVVTVASTGALRFWGPGNTEGPAWTMAPVLIHDIDFDPTGEYIAVLGHGGAVHLLHNGESKTVKRLWEAGVHFGGPRFSPDGKTLLAGGSDLTLRLWAVPSGEELQRIDLKPILPQATSNSRSPDVFFHPSEKWWLLSLRGGLVILDAATGSKRGEMDGQWDGFAEHVEFSPDGGRVLVVAEGTVLISSSDLRGAPRVIGEASTIDGATFDSRGDRIVTLLMTGQIEVRDVETLELLYRLGEPARTVRSLALSPDGQRLLTGSADGRLDLWDGEGGQHVQSYEKRHPREVGLVSFSPDGHRVLSVSDGYAYLWEAASGKQLRRLTRNEFRLRASSVGVTFSDQTGTGFSGDGDRFCAVRPYGAMAAVWDVKSGEILLEERRERTNFSAAALDPRGERLFLAIRDWPSSWGSLPGAHDGLGGRISRGAKRSSRIDVFDVATGTAIGSLRAVGTRPGPGGGNVRISPTMSWQRIEVGADGRLVAGVSWNEVAVWETSSSRERFRARLRRQLCEFSPDGRRLVFRDAWGFHVWDSETDEVQSLGEVRENVEGVSFSPDGRRLLVTGPGSSAELWDISGVQQRAPLKGHHGPITAGIFSPDGTWVATASADKTVRVWRTETRDQWLMLPHSEEVVSLLFSADGREVLTVTSDQKAHAWPLDILSAAKAQLRRPLTLDERERFSIGTVDEREKQRQDESVRRMCRELRLLAGVLRVDPDNPKARSECRKLAGELSSLRLDLGDEAASYDAEFDRTLSIFEESAVDSPQVMALWSDVLADRGDRAGAIDLLERASRPESAGPELESRLEALREQALPDLLTFASVDAALDFREEVIPEGATWRYLKGTGEPSPNLEWTEVSFDDSEWERGPSGFGYGDGDDATILGDMRSSYTTVYVRHVFERPAQDRFDDFRLVVSVDDGCIAYLNGEEIGRSRAGPVGSRLAHDALSASQSGDPSETVSFEVSAELFVAGKNVLALQGLNRALNSSDLTLIPVLTARPKPDVERDRARFDAFRGAAQGDDRAARIAYLEARLVERAGRFAEAAKRFEEISLDVPSRAEPLLGLVRCLKALRRFDEALAAVRRGFATRLIRSGELWDAWFELWLVDLRRDPESALAFLADQNLDEVPGTRRARELRWALEQIRSGGLRLNCGGHEYRSPSGEVWAEDRFFSASGRSARPRVQEIEGTVDDVLYRTERYFQESASRSPGYRIPLAPGRYRITLGFAEVYHEAPRRRRFDMFLEGERVLTGYEPKWARAETRSFERAVLDGFLEITFRHELDNPKVSTIEVERE